MNYSLTDNTLHSYAMRNSHKTWHNIAWVALGVGLLALASQCVIPWYPVPLTLQSATVIFLAALLGPSLAASTIASYLVLGLCGVPVFAEFYSGLHVFMGPTGGYLLGFLPAAYVAGYLFQKGAARHWSLAFLASLAAASIIFICGATVLSLFVGAKAAWQWGVAPFMLTEMLKLSLVAAFARSSWRASTR
ncbi:MAG: biotin transporter BioY [Gammaproteobacteria bacterium]|nr:biotin transporter BioY [Gammaproteobacteria bacterium]